MTKFKNNQPIGIFDSGLGGLTVLKQIARMLPHEDLIYLGDNARVPYGNRSKETVIKFSFENASFLLKNKVKCIVIACNTSSALAGNELESKLNVPVFDVIKPALKEARKISKSGKIGVIGTRGTIGSGAYDVPFFKACPLFVPFIEEGEADSPALRIVANNYLSELRRDKIDTLIMGCTHYPIIKDTIERVVDNNVTLVDPGMSVARELKSYLQDNSLMNEKRGPGKRKYYVTDYTDRFVKVAEMFLGHKIEDSLEKATL